MISWVLLMFEYDALRGSEAFTDADFTRLHQNGVPLRLREVGTRASTYQAQPHALHIQC